MYNLFCSGEMPRKKREEREREGDFGWFGVIVGQRQDFWT